MAGNDIEMKGELDTAREFLFSHRELLLYHQIN